MYVEKGQPGEWLGEGVHCCRCRSPGRPPSQPSSGVEYRSQPYSPANRCDRRFSFVFHSNNNIHRRRLRLPRRRKCSLQTQLPTLGPPVKTQVSSYFFEISEHVQPYICFSILKANWGTDKLLQKNWNSIFGRPFIRGISALARVFTYFIALLRKRKCSKIASDFYQILEIAFLKKLPQ